MTARHGCAGLSGITSCLTVAMLALFALNLAKPWPIWFELNRGGRSVRWVSRGSMQAPDVPVSAEG